jgi:hypothetical protein
MDGEIQRRVKNPLGNFSSKSCQDWAVGTHVIFFELIIANSLLIDMLLLCFDNHISCPQAVMGHILYHVISSLHPTNILFLIDTWLFEKLGILAPVSSKLGMKWEVRMKTVHRGGKKTGTKLVSSPKLEFHPHFWICAFTSLKMKPSQSKICKSSELIPSFTHFTAELKLRMKHALHCQTRTQG